MKQELNLVQEMLTGEIFIADKGKIVDEQRLSTELRKTVTARRRYFIEKSVE